MIGATRGTHIRSGRSRIGVRPFPSTGPSHPTRWPDIRRGPHGLTRPLLVTVRLGEIDAAAGLVFDPLADSASDLGAELSFDDVER